MKAEIRDDETINLIIENPTEQYAVNYLMSKLEDKEYCEICHSHPLPIVIRNFKINKED